MKTTDIYLVTNGDHKTAYADPSDAIRSLEKADLQVFNALAGPLGDKYVDVIPDHRDFLRIVLTSDGYLDFAGNTGTVISRITLHGEG